MKQIVLPEFVHVQRQPNLSVNSDFYEPKFPCSCDENDHYSKSGIYRKVYLGMAILCLGNACTNTDGFNPGMNDAGCGCADHFEENRTSPNTPSVTERTANINRTKERTVHCKNSVNAT